MRVYVKQGIHDTRANKGQDTKGTCVCVKHRI